MREHPSLLQHLVWKQGEAMLEPTRLCFPCFNVFTGVADPEILSGVSRQNLRQN